MRLGLCDVDCAVAQRSRFGMERQGPEEGTTTEAQALGQGPVTRPSYRPQTGSWGGRRGGQRGQRRKDRALQAVGWPSLLWAPASQL